LNRGRFWFPSSLQNGGKEEDKRKRKRKEKILLSFVPEYYKRQVILKGDQGRYRLLFTGEQLLFCHLPHSAKHQASSIIKRLHVSVCCSVCGAMVLWDI